MSKVQTQLIKIEDKDIFQINQKLGLFITNKRMEDMI